MKSWIKKNKNQKVAQKVGIEIKKLVKIIAEILAREENNTQMIKMHNKSIWKIWDNKIEKSNI